MIEILREINFSGFRILKTAIFGMAVSEFVNYFGKLKLEVFSNWKFTVVMGYIEFT